MGAVAERARRKPWKLPSVSVGEGNHHSVWRQIWKTCEGICGETGFRLLTVCNHGRASLFHKNNRFAQGIVLYSMQLLI